MIKAVTINNFRCFKSMRLENLSKFVLIGGKNNTGKTALLEAFFMPYDWRNPQFLLDLFKRRGIDDIKVDPDFAWGPLFNDCDMGKGINVSFEFIQQQHNFSFQLGPVKKIATNVIEIKRSNADDSVDNNLPSPRLRTGSESGYELKVTIINKSGRHLFKHFMHPKPNEFTLGYRESTNHLEKIKLPAMRTTNLSATTKNNEAAIAELSGLLAAKQEKKLLDFLHIIDSRIASVFPLPVGKAAIIYADLGLPSNIPINLMGAGTVRLLQLGLSIIATDIPTLLFDEIDAGMHYSIYPKMWESIANAGKVRDCQIIATTHSSECVFGAAQTFKAMGLENEFRYCRLDYSQKKGDIVPKMATSYQKCMIAIWF